MDFARKQLEKYGWTDGKGLGKHENGISVPLKPKIKRSVTGVGHDPASEFTEHWWTKLYDKAAENVEVEEKHGNTKKIKIKDEKFKITSNTWQIQSNQTNKHTDNQDGYSDYFVKKAILTSGGSKTERLKESDSESEEKKEKQDVFKLTDEELFAICEGRTAHKGARHGLKATGKLARIERQESILLTQPQYKGYSHAKNIKKNKQIFETIATDDSGDAEKVAEVKKKKKRKNKTCNSEINDIIQKSVENSRTVDDKSSDVNIEMEINDLNGNTFENQSKSKRKKKKLKNYAENVKEQSSEDFFQNEDQNSVTENNEMNVETVTYDQIPNKKKKHKKSALVNKQDGQENSVFDETDRDDIEKLNVHNSNDREFKKKKKKIQDLDNENKDFMDNSVNNMIRKKSDISNDMDVDNDN